MGVEPDPGASWRDIDLGAQAVSCRRALWIDLGGIAKGFAVDRAVAILRSRGALEGCVNAGGDLRVFGPATERVALRAADPKAVPILEVREGAVAASGGMRGGQTCHFNPGTRERLDPALFVCVTAPECMTADALTKAVLVMGLQARPVLAQHGASAHVFDPSSGWSSQASA
jgi:thiamine biosynthesis lipoprotein